MEPLIVFVATFGSALVAFAIWLVLARRAVACALLHRDDWIIQPYDRNTNHGHCRECGRTWATPSHPERR